jgi:hypothetical protein
MGCCCLIRVFAPLIMPHCSSQATVTVPPTAWPKRRSTPSKVFILGLWTNRATIIIPAINCLIRDWLNRDFVSQDGYFMMYMVIADAFVGHMSMPLDGQDTKIGSLNVLHGGCVLPYPCNDKSLGCHQSRPNQVPIKWWQADPVPRLV